MNPWSDEETNNPLLADDRNFYNVEKWTEDGRENRIPTCSLDGICSMAAC
jgi:hypothetical protein